MQDYRKIVKNCEKWGKFIYVLAKIVHNSGHKKMVVQNIPISQIADGLCLAEVFQNCESIIFQYFRLLKFSTSNQYNNFSVGLIRKLLLTCGSE